MSPCPLLQPRVRRPRQRPRTGRLVALGPGVREGRRGDGVPPAVAALAAAAVVAVGAPGGGGGRVALAHRVHVRSYHLRKGERGWTIEYLGKDMMTT